MNEYFTPPDAPASGARARSALIKEIIDAIDTGFDNIPASLQDHLDTLYAKWVEETGLPTLVDGLYLTNDGTDVEWADPLPDQDTHSGKVLTTDGSTTSWALAIADQADNADKVLSTNGTTTVWVDRLPDQGSSSGLFLTTDGTDESWASPFPTQATHADKVLKTDGTTTSWTARLPDQSGNDGYVLSTNGSTESWVDPDQFPDQTSKTGYTLQTDGTDVYWIDLPRTGSFIATADGAITQGRTVVLNSDGTVTQVAGGEGSPGTPVTFETGETTNISACYDSTNSKVVFAYQDEDDSNYGKAVVRTVSAGEIVFGATVTFSAEAVLNVSCCFADGVVFIAYETSIDSNGAAIAGTVSGTGATATITFGSAVDFATPSIGRTTCVYDEDADRVVVGYVSGASCKVVVATLTGTAIAFNGATQEFDAVNQSYIDAAYDTNYNRSLFYLSGINYGAVGICVVTGDEVAIVGEDALPSETTMGVICYDTANQKAVILYRLLTGDYQPCFRVVTVVSGTGVSFGNATDITSAARYTQAVLYDSNLGKVIGVIYNSTIDRIETTLGAISGTTISATSLSMVASNAGSVAGASIDEATNQLVVAYKDASSPYSGQAVLVDHNTTAFDWIGIAHETVTDGASVIVNSIGGINDKQAGLTTGATYYVDVDGDLTTSVTAYGEIGRALSATELLITKGGME